MVYMNECAMHKIPLLFNMRYAAFLLNLFICLLFFLFVHTFSMCSTFLTENTALQLNSRPCVDYHFKTNKKQNKTRERKSSLMGFVASS